MLDCCAPLAHELDPDKRFSRAQENRLADTFGGAHDVCAPVHPVREVNVEPARRAVHRASAGCLSAEPVGARILPAPVGLDLDQPHGRAAIGYIVNEKTADQLPSDDDGVPRIEGS